MDTAFLSELRSKIAYDPETGILTRLFTYGTGRSNVMGTLTQKGYLMVRFKRKSYLAHRIAWLIQHGEWPAGQIDHINGNRADNRLCNLRDVDGFTNGQNRHGANKNNPLGTLGVYKTRSGTFGAKIIANGRRRHLGHFGDVASAQSAYLAAKRKLHPGATI